MSLEAKRQRDVASLPGTLNAALWLPSLLVGVEPGLGDPPALLGGDVDVGG